MTPGVESMRQAGMPVTVGAYAEGAAAVPMSLDAMAQKMREGRLDNRLRRWGLFALRSAGIDGRGNESIRLQAQVLLDAARARASYASDPVASEYIPSAVATLCLDPDLCTGGDDCDGLTVALGSVFLAMGWPTVILKQNFGPTQQEHVLLEVQDERGAWFAVDPSTRLDAGRSVVAVSEERFDPLSVPSQSTGGVGAEIVTLGRPQREHPEGEPYWDGRHYWAHMSDGYQVWYKGAWQYADPGLPLGAAQGLGAGFVTPGDVLSYRKTWDAYVLGIARASLACADAWDAAAAGQTPATQLDTSRYAGWTRPDLVTTDMRGRADMQRIFAQSILDQWNAHANKPDWQILVQAEDILQDFQKVVLKVAQTYAPGVPKDCPGLELPAPPSLDLQAQVIGRIEGLGILAHGVLQLVTFGTEGALETYKEVGVTAKSFADKLADQTPWIAAALIVGAGVYAAVQIVPLFVHRKAA